MLSLNRGVAPAVLACLALAPAGCYFDFGESDPDGGTGRTDGDPNLIDGSVDPDGGDADAGGPDSGVSNLEPIPRGPFDMLSESELYSNIGNKTVRADIFEFEPEFKLWTDRAAKKRWIWIPPGATIGTANMGRWVFPVGTTVWKDTPQGGLVVNPKTQQHRPGWKRPVKKNNPCAG